MERRLFALQRLTALALAPLVLVHLGVSLGERRRLSTSVHP
jgi:succinate dehydrogenase hydrophobic anchor subunit